MLLQRKLHLDATIESKRIETLSWAVFIYSVAASQNSSARVGVWRRLQRLGAISPRSGVHVLPARADCVDALHWLAKEVQQAGGESLLMKVDEFDGLTDHELIELFKESSSKDYKALATQVIQLEEKTKKKRLSAGDELKLRGDVAKLRKKYSEISRTDFFNCPTGIKMGLTLGKIEQALADTAIQKPDIKIASIRNYKGKVWVTRPRPHVDRLSSAWLIRRFIDPKATIRYSAQPEPGELGFDLKKGGAFGHSGNLCTFEVLVQSFQLGGPALQAMSEMIHEIDLRDGQYWHPEMPGLDQILKGWLQTQMTDEELEMHGIALFEGLYQALQKQDAGGAKIKNNA